MKNGVEADDSWSSSLLSVSANNNPDCAIGKDAVTIKVEELSTMQNFDEFMNVTEPTMTVGTRTTGTLMAWGTATLLICKYMNKTFIILEHLDLWLLKIFLIMMLVMKFVDFLNLMLGVLKGK